jgi:hypothetical protein
MARCPAHEDRIASLSVGEGDDGRILLHCQAGCEPSAVLSALGLAHGDLFSARASPTFADSAGRIVAAYDYRDLSGTLRYQVVRHEPKGFRQRRPLPGGGWDSHGPGKGEWLPYRLPEFAGAETVYVVEGEKDADSLWKIGVPATCNHGGAGRWPEELVPCFRGKRVVVFPDNDAAGRRHAVLVARSLSGVAESVKVIALPDLPDKGDVSDWLAGREPSAAKAILLGMADDAPEWVPEDAEPDARHRRVALAERADGMNPEPVDWLWRGWLAAGKLHLLGGKAGSGKTTIAMSLAATVSCGGRWPGGEQAAVGNVVVWSGEDDPRDTLIPRLVASGADLSKVFFVSGVMEDGVRRCFDPVGDVDVLREMVSSIGDVRLLVIDPIVNAVAGDSHKNAEVRRGLQPLVDLCASEGAALLGITHFSKGTAGREPTERLTGSLAFGALARVVMVAAKPADGGGGDSGGAGVFCRAKSNIGADGGGFAYTLRQSELASHPGIVASSVCWGDVLDGTARELLASVEVVVGNSGGWDGGGALDEAKEFLRDILADGARPSKEIRGEARDLMISEATLRRAKKALGIENRRFEYQGKYLWALPGRDAVPETPRLLNLP